MRSGSPPIHPARISAGVVPRCNNVSAMKPQAPTAPKIDRNKLRFGLPGTSTERKGRIKAAIQANRETLRRLAR